MTATMDMKPLNNQKLPSKLSLIRALIDPFNDNNYYIFGNFMDNRCWYFNNHKQSFDEINKIPKHEIQYQVDGHGCAMFVTENNNKYALIYGGWDTRASYNIYNFQTKQWNDNAIKLSEQWVKNQNIVFDRNSEYAFGGGLSMITDLFEKNKIHIIGGFGSEKKYGYFEFNEQILNNSDLSCVFFCDWRFY